MASTFRTRSIRALFLPDAEYQGKYPPDYACHGICIPDDARHGFCLPDEECQGIFPSGRSGCLTEADCQGKCRPDGVCHGIYLPDEECQCIKLLDAARVFLTQGVKADGVRTTYAMAPRVQMQVSRQNASRRSCQRTTRLDAAAVAYPFWTRSVITIALRTQHVSSRCRVSRQTS